MAELDHVRARLLKLVREQNTDLKAASLATGRNAAYLHQFIFRGTPKVLPEDVRGALAEHLGVDEDLLRHRRIPPREQWRMTLLDAHAALRRGEERAGALAARAFEQAARLGQPQWPLIMERAVTESLLALAAQTGSPAALAVPSPPSARETTFHRRLPTTSGSRFFSRLSP